MSRKGYQLTEEERTRLAELEQHYKRATEAGDAARAKKYADAARAMSERPDVPEGSTHG